MLKLCVAGAAGRMGVAVIQEARTKGIMTVGAIEAPACSTGALGSPVIGKTLSQLGITDQNTEIISSDRIEEALCDADVFVSFTMPAAEVINIPKVANAGKRIILGTTGFTPEQNRQVVRAIERKGSSRVLAKLFCRR